jgi:hypothetical protein
MTFSFPSARAQNPAGFSHAAREWNIAKARTLGLQSGALRTATGKNPDHSMLDVLHPVDLPDASWTKTGRAELSFPTALAPSGSHSRAYACGRVIGRNEKPRTE